MTGGYLLYIFAIITNIWIQFCRTHVLPEGFHLSKSCQPVCKTEETCVVYRTSIGSANSVCIWLDPHRMTLDGTIIIPAQNRRTSETQRSGARNADSVRHQQTPDIRNVVKSVHDNAVDTAKAGTSVAGRQQSKLIQRMATLSKSLRPNLVREFGSLGKRPDLFSGKKASKSERLHSFKDKFVALNKASDTKKKQFTGEFIVRDIDGGGPFRRADQVSNEKIAVKQGPLSIQKKGDSSGKITLRDEWSRQNLDFQRVTTPRAIQLFASRPEVKKDYAGDASACKSCDPEHACPEGYYCYFSPTCAKQTCQHL